MVEIEKSTSFRESVNLINSIKRSTELMGNTQYGATAPKPMDIENIEIALTSLLFVINKIKVTASDGFQISDIFAYGSLVDDIIKVAKALPKAMVEKETLNSDEMEYLVEKFSNEGLKIIGIGTGENKYGIEQTTLAFMNIADIIILVKNALKNGIGIDDIAVLVPIIVKSVSIIMNTAEIGKEMSDLKAEEIAKLLAMLAAKILYVIKV